MVAALLRVVHGGLQDSRLLCRKGQPNIRFFVKAFIRAGRFTTQFTRIDFDSLPTLGNKATVTLPRKGHLISRIYMVTTMPDIATVQIKAAATPGFLGPTFGWTNSLGHALINTATLTIGGARVEQLDGRLLEIMDEFNTPLEKVELVNRLLQRNPSNFAPTVGSTSQTTAVTPLPFWFCGDAGAFLPIDAIQADKVQLSITFSALNTLYTSTARLPVAGATASAPAPVGGDAYFPLNSPFYVADPSGTPIAGLTGDPATTTLASPIPGLSIENPVLGDTYFMVEYVYLDRPEANRFRLADIQIPVIQHYPFDPVDTKGSYSARCPIKVPNPTRNLFFFLQRYDAPSYNAPFLATRDIADPGTVAPWWPNASRIDPRVATELVPGFVFRNSEPLQAISLIYEGSLYRYSTVAPSLFRSLLPSIDHRKSPWINRYYYTLPFGVGSYPKSLPSGEANLDKIVNINLQLDLQPFAGYVDPNAVPRYLVYVWAETYNIFRVYGGRAGMMFAY